MALLSTSANARANPAYSPDPVPFRFSLSRPIPARDIRRPIRTRNLNKTNQYSNPPPSLAGSLSLSVLLFFLSLFISFISISRRISGYEHLHLFGLFFSFAPVLHSLIQYRSVSFIRISLLNRAIFFPDLFNLGTDWVSTARMIGFILSGLSLFHLLESRKNIFVESCSSYSNNEMR